MQILLGEVKNADNPARNAQTPRLKPNRLKCANVPYIVFRVCLTLQSIAFQPMFKFHSGFDMHELVYSILPCHAIHQ